MSERADIVIGSGPSGIAVATALLARGRRVVMIDGGKPATVRDAGLQARLAAADPSAWSDADRRAWQAPQFDTPPGQVRRFGSDAAMETAVAVFADASPQTALRASLGRGGLSRLWGAAVAPYSGVDFHGWPIGEADLAPHYRAVSEFIDVAGSAAQGFRTHAGTGPSRQAEALLRRAKRLGGQGGVTLRPARTAVAPGCRQCGMCLHGCPWHLIWDAGREIERLGGSGELEYRAGPPVRAFAETGEGVVLTLSDGDVITGARVFVAAGVLQTARLLFASGLAENLTLRDSPFAFLPMLHAWSVSPRPDRIPLTTLPQLFAELDAPDLSPHAIHGQIYSWNEFFEHDLTVRYAGKLPGTGPFWRALARRLMVAQIFVHSDHGAKLHLSPDQGRLAVSVETGRDFGQLIRSVAGRMGRAFRPLGLHALTPAMRLAEPGASFHVGASLPMSGAPVRGQSDLIGRPSGCERIHVVDASVLPAVPARTITFSVMANAHRIGSLAP